MEGMKVFNYNDTPITFDTAAATGTMINATEMAKPFKKTTKDWLRTQQSKDFISSLSAVRQICPTGLVQIIQGGNDKKAQGTWMHEDVALEFARWLSPAFAIWCNDRIKEILMGKSITMKPPMKNFIPGLFRPTLTMIGKYPVWTVSIDNTPLYKFNDILHSIKVYEGRKRDTYKERVYVYRLHDGSRKEPERYIYDSGLQVFLRKIRIKDARLEAFKDEYDRYLRNKTLNPVKAIKALQEKTPLEIEVKAGQQPLDFLKEQLKNESGIVFNLINSIANINDREERIALFELLKSK